LEALNRDFDTAIEQQLSKPYDRIIKLKQGIPMTSQNSFAPKWMLPSAIAIVAFILYAHTIQYGFVFDDVENILNNPAVFKFHPSQVWQFLIQPWRALIQISYGYTHYLFGYNPAAYHLANVLIHALNSVFVFGIARLLAKRWISQDKVEAFAVAAGLIFAVHPLHSEAVAYVWGRSSSLCALFYFGSLLLMLIGFSKSDWKKILWFSGAVITGFLAWKTKEEAITLPFIAAGAIAMMGAWQSAILVALAPFALVAAQWRSLLQMRVAGAENSALVAAGLERSLDPLTYFLTSLKGIVCYYLKLYVFPVGQNADVYLKPVSGFGDSELLLAIVILGMLVALGIVLCSDRLFVFGLLALLVSPLTSYAIFPIPDVAAEHRIYISGLGFALLVAWILARLSHKKYWALACIVATFGYTTLVRERVWADNLTLWKDSEIKSPELARPHLNLGMAYQTEGANDLAMVEYEHALRVNPRLALAYINIAGIYFSRNDLDNSETALKTAMDLAPSLPAPYLNLAQIAMRRKQPQKALAILSRAQTKQSTDVSYLFHFTRGDVCAQLGRYADAAAEYAEAVRLRPDLYSVAEMAKSRMDQLKNAGALPKDPP
jgi:protein O-mannosyl-transferase